MIAATLALTAPWSGAAAPDDPPKPGAPAGNASKRPPPGGGAPAGSPPVDAASRDSEVEVAVLEALSAELHFVDAIRARLDDREPLAAYVRGAAKTLELTDAERSAQIRRLDSAAGRARLKSVVPESDDLDQLRVQIREDLLRIVAPLPKEPAIDAKSKARMTAAAIRLLRKGMPLPGDEKIWSTKDVELGLKIESLVASRAPRPQFRAWGEFAAWTLLAQGLHERALGVSNASQKWIVDAMQPPSAELVAVRAISLAAARKMEDAKASAAELEALPDAPVELKTRVRATTGR